MWRFYLLVLHALLDSLGCIAPHARREANVRLWPKSGQSACLNVSFANLPFLPIL